MLAKPAETDALPARRRSAAARLRRYRARQRAGEAVLPLTLPYYEIVEFLLLSKRLSEPEALDRARVEQAFSEAVLDLMRRWRKLTSPDNA
jgi:hypothetical protein